jgi:hypothetical protein
MAASLLIIPFVDTVSLNNTENLPLSYKEFENFKLFLGVSLLLMK